MKNFIRNPRSLLLMLGIVVAFFGVRLFDVDINLLPLLGIVVAFSGVRLSDIVIFPQLPKSDVKQEPQIGPSSKGLRGKNDIETQKKRYAQLQQTKDREVIRLPLSRLMGILKDLPLTSDKLKFLEENIDFLPNSLSLYELNCILDLFARDSDKLKITKALLSRLDNNYCDNEFERFKNHYACSSVKMKAINLLLRNEK